MSRRAQASLPGLPPELRNQIYHLVAKEVQDVSIIGRNIRHDGDETVSAEDRLRNAVAKHPLSQTCRQLRQDFDPTHRHYVITARAHFHLELSNYDLDSIGEFARLVKRIPLVLQSLRSDAHNVPFIRFHLNKDFRASLQKLEQAVATPGKLEVIERILKLEVIFRPQDPCLYPAYFSGCCEVLFNLTFTTMSAAEKRTAISQKDEMDAQKTVQRICNMIKGRKWYGEKRYGDRLHVTSLLGAAQNRAHAVVLNAKADACMTRADSAAASRRKTLWRVEDPEVEDEPKEDLQGRRQ